MVLGQVRYLRRLHTTPVKYCTACSVYAVHALHSAVLVTDFLLFVGLVSGFLFEFSPVHTCVTSQEKLRQIKKHFLKKEPLITDQVVLYTCTGETPPLSLFLMIIIMIHHRNCRLMNNKTKSPSISVDTEVSEVPSAEVHIVRRAAHFAVFFRGGNEYGNSLHLC